LDVVFDRGEERLAVGVSVGDEGAGAAVEVGEEVAKDVSGCFALWERGETHAVHVKLHCTWAKTKFEAVINLKKSLYSGGMGTYSSAFIQPSSSAWAWKEVFSASAPAAMTLPYLS